MSKKKFIIFGSSGFIGTHFINYIQLNNLGEVNYYDIRNNITEDVRQEITIKGDFNKEDIIINLAAVHTTPGHPDYEYFETNIRGAENVCSFAEKNGIQNIIFTSSIAPYGAAEEFKTEDTLPTPNTPYGISKLVAEKVHQTWQAKDQENRRLLVLRPGVVFGKGEGGNYTRLYKLLSKGYFFYPGRKDTRKACVYVKDLVEAAFYLLGNPIKNSDVFNFCYLEPPRIDVIVGIMKKTVGLKVKEILINGKLLMFAARVIGLIGGKKLGIHPDRVRKLMISTNISGEKLSKTDFKFPYGLDGGIKDWFTDCNNEGLY